MPGTRPPDAHAAAWDVSARHDLELLHAAREFVRGRWHVDASDGRWEHRAWLDDPGAAVVSCATATLDTLQAAWAPLACVETPSRAVVLMTTVNCGATQGADTRLIQDYLGHRNIQHTVRYTATNPARFERLWR